MRTAISNSSRRSAIRRPACRSARPTQNLKAAIAGETHEYTDMYPGMARTARDEGFDEIADWFETLAKAEKSHAGRFQKALDTLGARSIVARGTARRSAAARGAAASDRSCCATSRWNAARAALTRERDMREGSLEAPTRHPIDWQDPDFYDAAKLDAELRRVFDICHGCRRCFNLCDCFPRLFDLIDDSPTGRARRRRQQATSSQVVDACTLCDMCFMTKCPYVPPHEFNLDFPHLMLRYRAAERAQGRDARSPTRELAETDRNGKLARPGAPLANWATDARQQPDAAAHGEGRRRRPRRAICRSSTARRFDQRAPKATPPRSIATAPAFGRKAVLYATCFVNYNNPDIGEAARAVLAQERRRDARSSIPRCCGMPHAGAGRHRARSPSSAQTCRAALAPWIDKGYDVDRARAVLRA